MICPATVTSAMRFANFIRQVLLRSGVVPPRFAMLAVSLLLAGCLDLPGMSRWCFGSAAQCASQAIRTHPVHRLESWDTSMKARPVAQRVAAAPSHLVEYLGL